MLGLIPAAFAVAPPPPSPPPPSPPPLGVGQDVVIESYSYCLPSGLRVLLEPRRGRSDVSLVMVLEAGAAADPAGQEGLAHVVEHLWFRTPHLGQPDVWSLASSTGAVIDGATNADTVRYTTLGSRRNLRALLQVEGERLLDPLAGVDEATFAVEREIVRNELRQRWLDTGDVGIDALFEGLFPEGHPYARPVIGTSASLDAITLDDARAWAAEHYRPVEATLLVHADLDADKFGQLLEAALPEAARVAPASGPVGCGPRRAPEPPPAPTGGVRRTEANVGRRTAVFGWAVPAGLDSSALAQVALRRGEWLLSDRVGRDVDCGVVEWRQATVVTCELPLGADEDPDGVVRRAIAALPPAWESNQRGSIEAAAEGWSRARRSRLVLDLEDVDGTTTTVSVNAARHFHATADPHWLSTAMELGRDASFAEDVQDFGRKWLTRDRVAVAVVEPAPAVEVASLAEVHAGRQGRLLEDPGPVDLERLRSIVPDPDLSGLHRVALENGLVVVLVPYGDLPITRATLLLPGGTARAPGPVLDVLAYQVASDPRGGAVPYGVWGTDLGAAASLVAGRWTSSLGAAEWRLGIDGANLPGQLYLLRARVDDATTSKIVRARWSDRLAEGAAAIERDPDALAEVERWRHLAPGMPPWWVDETGVAEAADLRRQDVHAWKRQVLQPSQATLLVVGQLDPAKAEAEARKWFGSWTNPLPPPPKPAVATVAPPEGERVLVVGAEGRTQSTVTLACRMDPAAGDVAATLVATELQTRLFDDLRQERGQTYGVEAFVTQEDFGPTLTITARVPHAVAASTVVAFRDAVRGAAAAIDDRQLDRLKLATARRLAFELQTTEEVLERLAVGVSRGRPTELLTGRAEALASVDHAAIEQVLAPCAGREIVTVVGPPDLAVTPSGGSPLPRIGGEGQGEGGRE